MSEPLVELLRALSRNFDELGVPADDSTPDGCCFVVFGIAIGWLVVFLVRSMWK